VEWISYCIYIQGNFFLFYELFSNEQNMAKGS
jgi:hypothetical protein